MQTLIDALSLVNVGVPVYLIVTAPSVLPMAERGLMQGRELRPLFVVPVCKPGDVGNPPGNFETGACIRQFMTMRSFARRSFCCCSRAVHVLCALRHGIAG